MLACGECAVEFVSLNNQINIRQLDASRKTEEWREEKECHQHQRKQLDVYESGKQHESDKLVWTFSFHFRSGHG
jgi:hypothetical protein